MKDYWSMTLHLTGVGLGMLALELLAVAILWYPIRAATRWWDRRMGWHR